jgi:hypothetical protein
VVQGVLSLRFRIIPRMVNQRLRQHPARPRSRFSSPVWLSNARRIFPFRRQR